MADDKARLEKIITELRIENADLRGALMAIGATPVFQMKQCKRNIARRVGRNFSGYIQ